MVLLSILGSFYSPLEANPIRWEARWENQEPYSAPGDVEVAAEAPPHDFNQATTSVVAIVEDPQTRRKVAGLRDGSDPVEKVGAAIIKGGFSAANARLSFRFYTKSAHRNGSLLVRLANKEGKTLASFQLYAKGREGGEIQLNTFGPEADRRIPPETNLFDEKGWTPATLQYDGAALKWSLRIGAKEFQEIPVDASLVDTKVERFEIHAGFGAATKIVTYIDGLSFETQTP